MADYSALSQILDYRALGAMYEEYGRRGIPNPLFGYYVGDPTTLAAQEVMNVLEDTADPRDIPMVSSAGNGSVERFDTDRFEFIYLNRIKNAAPLNTRNAPARVLQPTSEGVKRMTMAHAFNSFSIGMDSLRQLREPDSWQLQRKGKTEIIKQMQDFATKHSVMKQVFLTKVLTKGVVYLDANGNILESSSGAVVTIDLSVPSGNKSQLNVDGGGDLITTKWSDASADIMKQLDNLKVAAEVLNVAPPRHVWLNGKNKSWLRNNTKIQTYFYGIQRLDLALNDETVEFNGYVFHFYSGTYLDSSGTTKYYIPVDQAIITPDLGPWFLNAIGLEYVPTSINIGGTIDEIGNNIAEVYGDFSYAKMEHNPVRADIFAGSNWMYGFRNVNSIFMPTVDF